MRDLKSTEGGKNWKCSYLRQLEVSAFYPIPDTACADIINCFIPITYPVGNDSSCLSPGTDADRVEEKEAYIGLVEEQIE